MIKPPTVASEAMAFVSTNYWFVVPLEVVRIIFLVAAIIAYIYTIVMLWKKEVYVGNLRLLLTVFPLSPTITLFSYFARHIITLVLADDQPSIAHVIISELTNTGVISRVLNCMNLIIDRLIALYYTNIYESTAPHLAIAVICIQFVGAALLALPCTYHLVDYATQAYILCSATFLFDVVFALLFIVAKRLHALHLRLHLSVQLRFLSVENYRAGRLLTYLMIAFTISNTAETLFFSLVYQREPREKPITLLLTIAELFLSLEVLAFVLLILCSHPSLKSSLQSLWICGRSSWIKRKIQMKVYSLDGRDLTVDPSQEQNFYFKTYAQMWEAETPH